MEQRRATRSDEASRHNRKAFGRFAPSVKHAAAAALFGLLGACGSEDPMGMVGVQAPGAAGTLSPTPTGAAGNTVVNPPSTIPTATAGTGSNPVRPPTGAAGTGSMVQPPDVMQPMAGNPGMGAGGNLPCGVSQALASNCQTCHGAKPVGGAPMSLVTLADLHKPAVTQPSMKVWQLSKVRMADKMRPMPPSGEMTMADNQVLNDWFTAGALASTAPGDANCMVTGPKAPETKRTLDASGRIVPAAGEQCFEFKVHGSTRMVDDTKYNVAVGEHYQQFYYDVPWPEASVATAYHTIKDNAAVLHHWLLFSTDENETHGYHKTVPLPTLIGTNPVLLAGWAVGGPMLEAPSHVGFELPSPGKQLNVQWHFYNSGNAPAGDNSSVQICTVPRSMRENVGAVAWLGTEDLYGQVWFGGPGMPPHQESTFKTNCVPGRRGLSANQSIHIIGFEPHMHRIGKNMKTSVNKPGGGAPMVIFDKPFVFGNETHYFVDYELKPGETLTTECSFNNTNDFGVPFGESSDTEMCYQFTFHYPAHSLTNGAPSILGVTDTCWSANL